MLSKSPSVAVRMMSPNWTSKDVLSAASGLWQGQKRESKVKVALQIWVNGPITRILQCKEAFKTASTKAKLASEMAQQAMVATSEPTDELVLHPKDLHVTATEPTPAGAL